MDLVTLVTACALSVEPKLMHALIWHSVRWRAVGCRCAE